MKVLLLSLCFFCSTLLLPKDVWEILAPLDNNLEYDKASKEYIMTPLFTKEMEALDQTTISIQGYSYLENQKDSQGKAIILLSRKHITPSDFYPSEGEVIQLYPSENYALQEGKLYTFQGTLHLHRAASHLDPKTLDLKKGEVVDHPFLLKAATCLDCSKN